MKRVRPTTYRVENRTFLPFQVRDTRKDFFFVSVLRITVDARYPPVRSDATTMNRQHIPSENIDVIYFLELGMAAGWQS